MERERVWNARASKHDPLPLVPLSLPLQVDEYSRTNVPSIWAVGDVTDRMQLTPVALMEGMALARTLVLNEPTKPNHMAVPSAVFSYPELATVVSAGTPSLPLTLSFCLPTSTIQAQRASQP